MYEGRRLQSFWLCFRWPPLPAVRTACSFGVKWGEVASAVEFTAAGVLGPPQSFLTRLPGLKSSLQKPRPSLEGELLQAELGTLIRERWLSGNSLLDGAMLLALCAPCRNRRPRKPLGALR